VQDETSIGRCRRFPALQYTLRHGRLLALGSDVHRFQASDVANRHTSVPLREHLFGSRTGLLTFKNTFSRAGDLL
jgi:hypothetical protein